MKNLDEQCTVCNNGLRSATAFLKRHGCTPIKGHYSQGYRFNSGFFYSPCGLLWYWSATEDMGRDYRPLFRRAKHLKDYTGATNRYPTTAKDFRYMIFSDDRSEKGADYDFEGSTKDWPTAKGLAA